MAQADTIKDFLVRLGYKVDANGEKRFTEGVGNATKGVMRLVTAIQAASVAVAVGVAKFAANMEALYFSAAKSGSSVEGVKAFGRAVQNLTGNAEDGAASLQSLARALRTNPGNAGILAALGVQARDANGNLRQTEDILADLGSALSSRPYYLAKQYADQLGIGEDTLRAITSPEFRAEMERQRQIQDGLAQNEERIKGFMKRLRELQDRVAVVGAKIGAKLLDVLGPQMEQAAQWFERNADTITQAITVLSEAIVKEGGIIVPILNKIAEGYRLIFEYGRKAYDMLPQGLRDKAVGVWEWLLGPTDPAPGATPPQSRTPRGAPPAAGKVDPMAFFMRMGWSKEQAAGIVANLKHESNFDPRAEGDGGKAYGVAQWHPDRQANFRKWAGKDIRESTLEEQLGFVNYELTQGSEQRAGRMLRAAENAQQAGAIVSRFYERPANAAAEAAKRAATAVNIAQTTNINVNGGSDPAATGRAVAGQQDRVNQNMVRNFQPAVQ